MVNLASGEITEEGLARWIRDNWPAAAVKAAEDNPKLRLQSRAPKTTAKKAAPKSRR